MASKIRANEEQYVIVGYGGKRSVDEEGKVYYPSLTARMIAGMVDVIIFTGLLLVVSSLIPWSVPMEGAELLRKIQTGELKETKEVSEALMHFMLKGGGLITILLQTFLSIAFAAVYVLPFWFRYAATPGKMLMRMKIVSQDSLEKPSKKRFFLRFIWYPLSFFPPGFGFMWVVFNKRKRSWHDYLSGTMVIYTKKPRIAL